ncbi:hypothetical protein EZS27_007909 [termite gut metagenome]|uniref:Lipoprotein n=1 Tax=termite gut metagenome TaxID=433724 RepID=A0A5J4SGR6_9ZZZZ
MSKLFMLAGMLWLLAACSGSDERKAEKRLLLAREAFEIGNHSEARNQIDSVKILYPKAFEARKEGIRIMRQIDLREQQQGLVYLENTLTEKQTAFEAIKNKFVLEKDTEYQEMGNYFWPTQTVEKNINRSYLRFQVNESGAMTMTSIYCGASYIHHTGVKVIAPDGSFAGTPASEDSYETSDLDVKIEKADYPLGKDGNVIGFIYLNRDKNIRVDYQGERAYTTTMDAADRRAVVELYELSQILSSIEQVKKEIEETNRHIEFVKRNMEGDDTAENNR